jgi:trimeric autotransporter adhesin
LMQTGACKLNGTSIVCGTGSQAGLEAFAAGDHAQATGSSSVAIGSLAMATNAGAVAIGSGASATADPTTAVGTNAVASGTNATALGANSIASATNSVALGQGSVADRANTVSVGSAQLQRQITNVAAGTQPTDAVNLQQLNLALGQVNAFAAQGTAESLAVPSMPQLAPGKKWLGMAYGNFAGQSALGIGFGYQIDEHWNTSAGVSTSTTGGSSVASKVQAGFQW